MGPNSGAIPGANLGSNSGSFSGPLGPNLEPRGASSAVFLSQVSDRVLIAVYFSSFLSFFVFPASIISSFFMLVHPLLPALLLLLLLLFLLPPLIPHVRLQSPPSFSPFSSLLSRLFSSSALRPFNLYNKKIVPHFSSSALLLQPGYRCLSSTTPPSLASHILSSHLMCHLLHFPLHPSSSM